MIRQKKCIDTRLDKLLLLIKEYGYTRVAKEANISRSSLYKVFTDHENPTLQTVDRLAKLFGYELKLTKRRNKGAK